jgi:hypothetical protein
VGKDRDLEYTHNLEWAVATEVSQILHSLSGYNRLCDWGIASSQRFHEVKFAHSAMLCARQVVCVPAMGTRGKGVTGEILQQVGKSPSWSGKFALLRSPTPRVAVDLSGYLARTADS